MIYYVIDSSAQFIARRKEIVKGIIINHSDENYHKRVLIIRS